MDPTDLRILKALQTNPTIPISELAEIVGLSQTPCWRRLKRLEGDGTILRRAVILDPARLGLTVNVFAHIRLKQHDEETLEALDRETQRHPQIVECFSMSGDSDYMLRVVVHSVDHYDKFLKKVLLHMPGVASINSSFALQCVKSTTDLPI
jgi:Lrp/AsnC family transcriptional regulator